MQDALSPNVLRFGPFDFDIKTGELHKAGRKILLQEQPFQVLKMLVANTGELLTRDEIRRNLWPNDTVVEFDRSINAVVKKLRLALGDSAEDPHFIETVARRGYRLIVPVERTNGSATDSQSPQVSEAAHADLTGKKISHYRVLEILGGGGMGVVYRAEDLKLGRSVAVKFLPEELVNDAKARERFEREARTASSLDHPGICPIYEFGEHDGQHFLVMPLLQGQTLRDRLTEAAPLPIDQLVDLAVQIAEGLEAAHHKGIIHRDVKPANVFIANKTEAKILDFGLARLDAGTESAALINETKSVMNPDLTGTGIAMGTAAYMSPEQVRGEKLDSRTDLFSFGVVLYEMATRTQAFTGGTAAMLHEAIVNRSPVPARQLNPEVPPKLEAIIARALEKDRCLRYQTASEIRADLLVLKRITDPSRQGGRWPMRAAAAIAVLVVATAILWLTFRKTSSRPDLKQRQLTANSSDNAVEEGVISPDGKYLAYVDGKGIHIELLETGELHSVPVPEALKDSRVGWDIRPWSNTKFLATVFIPGRPDSAWVISVMGGAPHKLRDDAYPQSASSDGSLIAFTRQKGKVGYREIWLMGPNGEGARKFEATDDDSGFRDVTVSPDGHRVGYMKEHRAADRLETSLETRGLDGGPPSTVLSGVPLWLYTWMPDGRIIYVLSKQDINGLACDCWEARLDTRTGKPVGQPVRLTNWAGFCVGNLSATADGRQLVFNRWSVQRIVYVAELASGKAHITTPRRLTLSDGQEYPAGWSADSKEIVFVSNRLGSWGIFKQSLGEDDAEALVTGLGNRVEARISPDGRWVICQEFTGLTLGRLTRIPLAGGIPQPILTLMTAIGHTVLNELQCPLVRNIVEGNHHTLPTVRTSPNG